MAAPTNVQSLILRLACSLALVSRLTGAPLSLTLEEAASRATPDFSPLYAGKTVSVKGVVAALAIPFLQYEHLPIQDGHHGLVLEGRLREFSKLVPGDEVEVTGTISSRAGPTVLTPASLKVLFHGAAPFPQTVGLDQLRSFAPLGLLVTCEGRVVGAGETAGGTYVAIGDSKNPYRVFLPFSPQKAPASFTGLTVGDKIRATGMASQYCPVPPYNRWFELVVADTSAVVRLESAWPVNPFLLAGVLAVVLGAGALWWTRERHLRAQREMLTAAHELGEEILGFSSHTEILKRIATILPRIFQVTHVRLYTYNRGSKALEEVQVTPKRDPVSIPTDAPVAGLYSGVATCFLNRTQLAVPDTGRSPFAPLQPDEPPAPRSVFFIPMIAQGDVIGVLQLDHDRRTRTFSRDEQTLAQHLGNQIGLAIQLLGQRTVREQLFRSEKLAAVGRLISGVVNELQAPLATISKMADSVLAVDPYSAADRELRIIASEGKRASDIVTRLVAFAGGEQQGAKPVDVNRLLHSLVEFREREWKVRGLRVQDLLSAKPLVVMGSQGQLEQVLLNLLVYVEQSVSADTGNTVVLRTSLLAKRVLIEIGFSRATEAGESVDPFSKWSEANAGALGLGVCRSIIAGHGGEVRLVQAAERESRFEIELPAAATEARPPRAEPGPRDRSHQRTALLMEPEEPLQRQLMTLLGSRGYRVVPVQNAEIGLDLAHRLRFNLACCAIRLPGLNWVELSERLQPLVDAFVLLSDGYDPDLATTFETGRRFVLTHPIDEAQLDRVLAFAEAPRRRHEAIAG
jgi:CheY-like chemotaxis protein